MAKSKATINSDIIIADLHDVKKKLEENSRVSAETDKLIKQYLEGIIKLVRTNIYETQNAVSLIENNYLSLNKQSQNLKELHNDVNEKSKAINQSISVIDGKSQSFIDMTMNSELQFLPDKLKSIRNTAVNHFFGILLIVILVFGIQLYFIRSNNSGTSEVDYEKGYKIGRQEMISKINTFFKENPDAEKQYHNWNKKRDEN